jgi:hypothetical protein
MAKTLRDGRFNLRGWEALVDFNGHPHLAKVITHTRNGRWLVEGICCPRKRDVYGARKTVHESEMTLTSAPKLGS